MVTEEPRRRLARIAGATLDTATTTGADGRLCVVLSGEIDMTSAPRFEAAVSRALDTHQPPTLELNLAGVTFMDSSGIRVLLRVHQAARARECTLTIGPVNPAVARVLDITGVRAVLDPPPL
jgi:anti-anti-sigma factor